MLFAAQPELREGAADGGLRAVQAEAVTDLGQGEVGLLGQEAADLVVALRADGRGAAAGVGARLQAAGRLAQAEEGVDRVDRDAEEARQVGGRADAAVDGFDQALTEFQRVGMQGGIHPRLARAIRTAGKIIGRQWDS